MTKPANAADATKLLQNIYAKESTHQQDAFNLMDYINDPAFVRVPVEPTEAMLNAAIDVHGHALCDISLLGIRCSPQSMFRDSYAAMIAASKGEG